MKVANSGMALFLSTYLNKVDKKGRVSVPAQFRSALASENFQGVVVFRSNHHAALEGFSWSFMEEIGQRLDHFDLFSDSQDDLATAVFGDSVQLPFDGDGRIVLPKELMDFAQIEGSANFVGLGKKFQIWNPKTFKKRREDARTQVKVQGLTIPKGGA
jgi:MraZ protein